MRALPRSLVAFFWHFIKPQWGRFTILLITMLGWSVQEAVYPYFVKLTIDQVSQYSSNKGMIFSALSTTLAVWVTTWLAIEIAFRIYDFSAARVYPQFQAAIRTQMFDYTMQHSHQYFSDNFAGTLASKISRMADSMLSVVIIVFTIFFPVIMAFVINIFILYQSKPIFALIMAAWFILHLSIAYYFTQRCAILSAEHSAKVTSLNGKIVDALSNIMNVRLFSRRRYEMQYMSGFQGEEIKASYHLLQYNAWMKLFLGTASQVFAFTMIFLGIYSWQKDWLTIGDLSLILSSLMLMGLGWYMSMHLVKVYEDVGTCRESLTLVQKLHDIVDHPTAKPLEVPRGEIVFDNVSFYYSKHHKIFKEKNVTIPPSQKVGLVGYSGSGKTTFVNLILRHFEIESGAILIDGQDIKMVTQESLREKIALIPQDTTLFHRTLMENIRYGRLNATDAEVKAAALQAHCAEFIDHMEKGYDTLVGERGIKLSGGQRQRIAIARAILKNAPILIMDEATSSLDSMTEKYIQDSLKTLMKNRTTIVIAHRLSTLADMDRILVFKRGHIIEDGTHAELIRAKGHYADLWNMQAGGFLPEDPDR